MNNADQRSFQLQLPLFTYPRLRGKQTNGGGSGWSIDGRKKYNELFMAIKADRTKDAKQFNPQLLLFIKLGAAANCKLNTTQRTIHVQRRKRRIIV
jgi:hypothetical protein